MKREIDLSEAMEDQRAALFSSIRRMVGDPAEAEDLLQDVFAEFIEVYDLGAAIETVGAWLMRVARNKVLDRFRRRRTQANYQALAASRAGPEEAAGTDNEWMRDWLREEIIRAIESLPAEQREVFVMNELEGKTFEEIAAETGTNLNTLLSRKRYAVRALRAKLKEVYDEL